MANLRALLLVLASATCVAVAIAGSAQLPYSGSAAGALANRITSHTARPIPLGFDYQLAGEAVAVRMPGLAAVAATIPEPPIGASVAGAALIGLVVWTRRRRA